MKPNDILEAEAVLPSYVAVGLANQDGSLTEAGMLKLHQLKLLEHCKRVSIPKREEKMRTKENLRTEGKKT